MSDKINVDGETIAFAERVVGDLQAEVEFHRAQVENVTRLVVHWQGVAEAALKMGNELRARNDRLWVALENIRDGSGQVCPEFETCDHGPCQGSAHAKLIALEALSPT